MKSRLLALVTAAGIAITGAVLVVPTGAIANPPRTAGAVQSSDTDAASSCRQGAARCPFYLYDYGHRRDGAFGANMEYSLLSYATRGRFVVQIDGFEFTRQRLNAITVWFDVSRRNSGPEYVFDQEFAADGDGHTGRWVGKVDTWGWNGRSVQCAQWRTHVNYATDVIRLTIPRRCLGSPAKVRWSPTTWRLTRYDDDGTAWGTADGAPYYRKFASWWAGRAGGCTCRQPEGDTGDLDGLAVSEGARVRHGLVQHPALD